MRVLRYTAGARARPCATEGLIRPTAACKPHYGTGVARPLYVLQRDDLSEHSKVSATDDDFATKSTFVSAAIDFGFVRPRGC